MRLSAGDRLGHYEILATIGAGGMGEVYRAKDFRLGREVAVKVLPDRFLHAPDVLHQFEREARTLASLSHPNIVVLHDIGTETNVPDGPPVAYAVMELLEGETLGDRLARSTLNWRQAIGIAASVADGLSAAHEKGIIHRDLKPGNIFLTNDGRVKIVDFGLARPDPAAIPQQQSHATTVTAFENKGIEGTIGYMSPEQLQGKPGQTASDVFSLGCCLYEMIGHRKAFAGESPADIVAATIRGEPAPLRIQDATVPAGLQKIIYRCLHRDPVQRFRSAHDLAIALRDLEGVPTSERQWNWLTRRSVAGVLLIVVTAFLGAWALLSRRGARADITSIAVLPFTNLAGDSETEYLSEGLTEALINSLSHLPQLTVMSLSAVSRYRSGEDPRTAGRSLGVQAVLTGKLVQRAHNVRVAVALVDVESARNLWGEEYSRRMDELLALQDDIAAEISEQLHLRLNRDQQKQLVRRSTSNTEAYQLYLQGRHHWRKRTAEGTQRAIAYFEEAIVKDPEYALAWSGLADAWVIGELPVSPREAANRARVAAMNAARLDDALTDVHISLSRVRFVYDRNWAGAENEARKALERNPKHAEAHRWYSVMLTRLGRMAEAEREVRRALDLDPLNPANQQTLASLLYWAGRDKEAEEEFRKILDLDANSAAAHAGVGLIQVRKGVHEAAVSELRKAVELAPGNVGILSDLGYVYAVARRRDEARKVIEELLRQASKRPISSHYVGSIYAGLGDKNRAIEWLERAYQEGSQWLPHAKLEPQLASLRDDPRFANLLRKIGF